MPGQTTRDGTDLAQQRERMLALLRTRVRDERVIAAMSEVPREAFVAGAQRSRAYEDGALPIGEGQTISQPLIVALMIEALEIRPGDHVLEVGSGSGYAAAVLSRLAGDVVAVERVDRLRENAEATISNLGFTNIRFYPAGRELGHNENAPYDAILVSAGAPHVPRALVEQLRAGGRMIVPIGDVRGRQELVRVASTPRGLEIRRLGPCAFVPLIGEDAWPG